MPNLNLKGFVLIFANTIFECGQMSKILPTNIIVDSPRHLVVPEVPFC